MASTASKYSIDTLARLTWPSTRPMKMLTSATAASAQAYPDQVAAPAPQERHRGWTPNMHRVSHAVPQ